MSAPYTVASPSAAAAAHKLCTESIESIQQNNNALVDRMNSLPRRFSVSQDSSSVAAPESALTAGREVAFLCGVLRSHAAKALEGAAEEVRVRAAQLEASAEVLESEAEAESGECEGTSVAAAARALLSCTVEASPGFTTVMWDSMAALEAVDTAVRIRDGVDPSLCSVRGNIACYHKGDNSVAVAAVDAEGDVVESIEAEDVCVCVEGAKLASVSVGEVGMVEVVYHVPEGRVEPVCVSMSVCGAVLPGSPWTIPSLLGDSAILASVAPERLAAFLRELSAWLPRRAYTLLYRGSRDGMTAAAFHRLCDGKGPTLVLVRCDKGWVFGGHAGASWESPLDGAYKTICSSDAFLFSVTGPYTDAPVRLPVKADKAEKALYCREGWGPVFTYGLYVQAGSASPEDCFDKEGSRCDVGVSYSCFYDVIGRGDDSLTGAEYFLPTNIEVYSITPV